MKIYRVIIRGIPNIEIAKSLEKDIHHMMKIDIKWITIEEVVQ